MIDKHMKLGDLVLIGDIETEHTDKEGLITTPGGYYPISFLFEESDGYITIGLRIDDEEVLYIPQDLDEIIKDHIIK